MNKILGGSLNFIVVQAYGCVDEILFYLVIDLKTNKTVSSFININGIEALMETHLTKKVLQNYI
ncbi:MAG: hypothetical protein EOO93_16115 [Pedobacter sp.]|nr:MAG: hypothetical protein EOO93_16115 [Pedobacter sp.]